MDYLLSREKLASGLSNHLRARSILVHRKSVLTMYIPSSDGEISVLYHEFDVDCTTQFLSKRRIVLTG